MRRNKFLALCPCGKFTSRAYMRTHNNHCKACFEKANPTQTNPVKGKALKALVKSLTEAVTTKACDQDALKRAKQQRFALSASLLASKDISVSCINVKDAMPASYNVNTNELILNSAWPKADSEVEALIYDRSKLYHELGHALFTTSEGRETLCKRSCNQKTFLAVSNILEDGRIEKLLKRDWRGSADYLNALLAEIAKQGDATPIGGLILYVRSKLWRNAKEASYWQPCEAMIHEALDAKETRRVCEIAFRIVEMLFSPPSPQVSPQGEVESEGEGEGEGEGESEGEGEGESEGEGEREGEGEGEGEREGEREGEGEGEGSVEQSKESLPSGFDKQNWEKLQDIVRQAKANVGDEAANDLEAIIDAALSYEVEQEYSDNDEYTDAASLTETFRSIAVETARVKYEQSRSGLLNTQSLASALTTRRCFQRKEETLSLPLVALLLDASGSMSPSVKILEKAARIINGALMQSKIKSKVISFGGCGLTEHKVIKSLPASGGTPTGHAMKAANDWLEKESAERGLVIVVTDGLPGDRDMVDIERERCQQLGGHTIGVLISEPEWASMTWMTSEAQENQKISFREGLASQFHDFARVENIADLPNLIEGLVSNFIAG